MTCPVCGGVPKVKECRKDCETVVRRRICKACGYIFYTEEVECDKERYMEIEREYMRAISASR